MQTMINKENKNSSSFPVRPPIVVVLGHVDHGKTKLLDTIRKTKVAEGESGGITQHIGAYQVEVNGKIITFLDTPGHEAFTAIRSRGTKIADVAVLVVAADESVKPQTREAIKIINEEKIPFIVAINKIDKEGANPQKVRQDLASQGVLVEDWGGKVPVVEISAKAGKNINELLDMVLLVAEIEELKEDISGPAQGVIIESDLDKRRGYVATAIVKKGILRTGDWIVVGSLVGKVKAMQDFMGRILEEAKPSQPALIIGWSQAPAVGSGFLSSQSKSEAQKLAMEHKVDLAPLFSFFAQSAGEEIPEKKTLRIILKSDVQSSLEALEYSLRAIKSDEVRCSVVAYDIGNIGESDVKMAIAMDAKIFGFRVDVDGSARKLAEKDGISVQTFDVIYELIEAVRKAMGEFLAPEVKRAVIGKLKVLAIFKKQAKTQIIGGRVTSGKMMRGASADILRGANKIAGGKIGQLQQNKVDVTDVQEGSEAGIRFDSVGNEPFDEVKEGDIVEVYQEENIKRDI